MVKIQIVKGFIFILKKTLHRFQPIKLHTEQVQTVYNILTSIVQISQAD